MYLRRCTLVLTTISVVRLNEHCALWLTRVISLMRIPANPPLEFPPSSGRKREENCVIFYYFRGMDSWSRAARGELDKSARRKLESCKSGDIVARRGCNLSRDSTWTRNTNMILGPLTNIRVSIYLRANRARGSSIGRDSKGNQLAPRAPSGFKPQDLNQFPLDKSSGDAARRQIFHWPYNFAIYRVYHAVDRAIFRFRLIGGDVAPD